MHSPFRQISFIFYSVLVLGFMLLAASSAPASTQRKAEVNIANQKYTNQYFGFSVSFPYSWKQTSDITSRDLGSVLELSSDLLITDKEEADPHHSMYQKFIIGLHLKPFENSNNLIDWTNGYLKSSDIDQTKIISQSELSFGNYLGYQIAGITNKNQSFVLTHIARGNQIWFIWTNSTQNKHIYDILISNIVFESQNQNGFQDSELSYQNRNLSYTAGVFRLPFSGTREISAGPGCITTHQGLSSEAIDYALSLNTPLYASHTGTVSFVGWNTQGYGNLIKLYWHIQGAYLGYQSMYAHLNSFNVYYTSQQITKGQLIGYSGATGNVTGAHLHFEVRNPNNQSVWIRSLTTTTWYSGSSNTPCFGTSSQRDGSATH